MRLRSEVKMEKKIEGKNSGGSMVRTIKPNQKTEASYPERVYSCQRDYMRSLSGARTGLVGYNPVSLVALFRR